MLQFLTLLTLFSRLFCIICKRKLLYFDQTSVLYILKYHTLLGKFNFRSSHFSNSACIWSAKNESISCVVNLISKLWWIICTQKLPYLNQTSDDWVKKCREMVVEGGKSRSRNRKTWMECVEGDMLSWVWVEWMRRIVRGGGGAFGEPSNPCLVRKHGR